MDGCQKSSLEMCPNGCTYACTYLRMRLLYINAFMDGWIVFGRSNTQMTRLQTLRDVKSSSMSTLLDIIVVAMRVITTSFSSFCVGEKAVIFTRDPGTSHPISLSRTVSTSTGSSSTLSKISPLLRCWQLYAGPPIITWSIVNPTNFIPTLDLVLKPDEAVSDGTLNTSFPRSSSRREQRNSQYPERFRSKMNIVRLCSRAGKKCKRGKIPGLGSRFQA